MKLTKRQHNKTASMNMTSMIDIVFLLLIFFMTVTQISKVEKERLELPKLAGTDDQKPTTLIVNVNQEGAIVVYGREVSLTELVTQVGEELVAVGNEPARLTVVLRADRRGTSRTVNEVVQKLSALGIRQVRIAVQTES